MTYLVNDGLRSRYLLNHNQALYQLSYIHSDPGGVRTLDPRIKSAVLYQLSYEIIFNFGDPGGIRTHALPIKSRRLEPTQLRGHLWNGWVSNPLLWIFSPAQSPDLPPFQIIINKKSPNFLRFGLHKYLI
jgi:hypothetical protein